MDKIDNGENSIENKIYMFLFLIVWQYFCKSYLKLKTQNLSVEFQDLGDFQCTMTKKLKDEFKLKKAKYCEGGKSSFTFFLIAPYNLREGQL